MVHIVDLILIACFFLMVIIAAKKGFAKIIMNIGATILSFIAAYTLSRPAADFLYEQFVRSMIENSIADKLEENTSATDALTQARSIAELVPEGLVNLGDKLGLNISTLFENLTNADFSSGNIAEVVTDSVFKPIVIVLMTAVCGLIIFILASFIFGLIAKLINKVFKLPLIKSVNKGLGALLGVVEGIIFLLIICTLVYYAGGIIGGKFGEFLDNSYIIDFVNTYNPVIAKFSS